jgi:SAM-dependent methyltransferase
MDSSTETLSKKDITERYNDLYSRSGHLRDADALYRWTLDLLVSRSSGCLLDVACGEGVLLHLAQERGLHSVGVDLAYQAMTLARQASDNTKTLVADGENLPFPTSCFDYVTNLGSLEHFLNPMAGIHELCRVLKPEGRAAILLPNSYYLPDIVWHVWRTGYGPSHKQPLERFATYGEWKDLLEQGGLEVERGYKYNFRFPRTILDWRWYFQHPRKFIYLVAAPLLPFHLSYSFLYICRCAR